MCLEMCVCMHVWFFCFPQQAGVEVSDLCWYVFTTGRVHTGVLPAVVNTDTHTYTHTHTHTRLQHAHAVCHLLSVCEISGAVRVTQLW